MEWKEEARGSFRAVLWSAWGLVLAVAILAGPVVLALGFLSQPANDFGDPMDTAIGMVTSAGAYPSGFVMIALVVMLAVGALPPGRSASAALVGRIGALATLLLLGWALPMALVLSSRLGSASLAPVAIATVVVLLEIVAIVTLLSLFAEFGRARAAALGLVLVVLSSELLPLLSYAFLAVARDGGFEAYMLWTMRIGFLHPSLAADSLLSAVFPRTLTLVDAEILRLDHPVLFSPWLWLGVMAAWIVVPLGILLGARPGAAAEDEDGPQFV